MRVLVGCEFSGAVRRAFRERGHDAWSCDLLPAEDGAAEHLRCDVLTVLGDGWDLAIFHPPCTYLTSSGLHWNGRVPGRAQKTEEALAFVRALLAAPIGRIALENPAGRIGTAVRPSDQSIQPYDFGADASKRTCLWLKNLPPLTPTQRVRGRLVKVAEGQYVERWANQTDSGQNKLGPSADRWALRSITYDGVAAAMAEQWGTLGPRQEHGNTPRAEQLDLGFLSVP